MSGEVSLTRHISSDEPRVLVVDGSRVVRQLIERVLKNELPNAVVIGCGSGAEARTHLEGGVFDLVTTALRLPDRYLITPALPPEEADTIERGIERACRKGVRLIQLRLPGWPSDRLARLARTARNLCRSYGAQLLLNADWKLAAVLGLDGVHLPAAAAATLVQRPLPADRWVGVSCHDARELVHAARIGADFATLGPVFPTPSHEDAPTLGWERFADLVAESAVPVYALGGLEIDDIDAAQVSGAQGVAAIRALWRA
jgi:8-oxo-dGTP diphosphatase